MRRGTLAPLTVAPLAAGIPEAAVAEQHPAHHPGRRRRRLLWTAIRATVGIGAAGYVISLVHVDDLARLIEPRHLVWAGMALACLAANAIVAAWRWQVLLRGLGVQERLAPLIRAIYVGAFYNLFLPGQLGGQAIKVMVLARRSPTLPRVVASVAMDQMVIIIALFLLAIGVAAVAPPLPRRLDWVIGFSLALVASVALLLVAINPRLQRWLVRRARRSGWFRWLPDGLRVQTMRTMRSVAHYGRQPRLLVAAVGQGVLFVITLCGMAYGLASAVGIELDVLTISFVLCLAVIAGVAPFTLAGLGTREATFTAALVHFGVHRGIAATFAVVWLFVNAFADAMGALMQLWHPRQRDTAPRRSAAGGMASTQKS